MEALNCFLLESDKKHIDAMQALGAIIESLPFPSEISTYDSQAPPQDNAAAHLLNCPKFSPFMGCGKRRLLLGPPKSGSSTNLTAHHKKLFIEGQGPVIEGFY